MGTTTGHASGLKSANGRGMALSAIGTAMKLAPTAEAEGIPVGTVQIGAVTERVTARASRNRQRARVDPWARARLAERLRDLHKLLVLLVPVVVVAEHREGRRERRIGPAARDPARHVDDPHRPQRLAQSQARAIELTEQLVTLQQILPKLSRLLGMAPREQPDVLHRRADQGAGEGGEGPIGAPGGAHAV